MQTAIDCVIGDSSVATGPAVLKIQEKQIVDCAEIVVLDPGRAAVGCVKEGVAGSPTVKRVHKRDGVHLKRH